MREVGAFEAKNRFGTLLDWVEKGEEVVITRRGKGDARLVTSGSGCHRATGVKAVHDRLDRAVGASTAARRSYDPRSERDA